MLARLRLAVAHRLRPEQEFDLGIEAGQVVCPKRGVMDIEDCFICTRYRGHHGDRITCAASGPGLIPAIGSRTVR